MSRDHGEITLLGRLAIAAVGLLLIGGFWSESWLGDLLGVVGIVLIAAATGVVELAMALWYRTRRARPATK